MPGIDGVLVLPLKIVGDERGNVMHVLRADAPHFQQFGEAYFSTIHAGVTKGWKLHKQSTSNMVVSVGRVRFVLHDVREGSPTRWQFQEIVLDVGDDYCLLVIPPGVAYAWRNAEQVSAMVLNCASVPWSVEECLAIPMEAYPYTWK